MSEFKLTGGCLCGNVRYTITKPAIDTHHCHCSICRRITGALFLTLSIFPRDAFTYEKGKTPLSTYSSSAKLHRNFCKNCGAHVTLDLDAYPDQIWVTTGTIDNGAHPGHPKEVYRHAFFTSKVPWLEIKDDLPKVEGFK